MDEKEIKVPTKYQDSSGWYKTGFRIGCDSRIPMPLVKLWGDDEKAFFAGQRHGQKLSKQKSAA